MTLNEERADVRFWTTYDHIMFEREARELRRKHVRAMMRTFWKRAKARIVQSLKHAGAQPARPQARPA